MFRRGLGCAALCLVLSACGQAPGEPSVEELERQRLPTLEAQLTQFAQNITGTPPFSDPAAVATLRTPLAPEDIQGLVTATVTPASQAGQPEGGPVQAPGAQNLAPVDGFDGGDGYTTTVSEALSPGQTRDQAAITVVEGHNYLVQAAAGESFAISVMASGGADIRLKLLGPDGSLLLSRDGGAQNAPESLAWTASEAGTYTVRLDAWDAGTYSITLTRN